MRMPLPILLELCEYACARRSGFGLQPATSASVERISDELGIRLPVELVDVSRECPSYGSWFAGLGEDYSHPMHILRLNEEFHGPLESDGWHPLPEHLVLLNHGHDGDCDCWDTSELCASGEHPIVYLCLDADELKPERRFETFRDYLQDFCGWLRRGKVLPEHRLRVQEILAEYSEPSGADA